MVEFKDWLLKTSELTGTGATKESLMHGGLSDTPFNPGNSNMPCRSKHQAQDGAPVDDEPYGDPAKLFGFRKWMDKKPPKRPRNRIHKPRAMQTGIPMRADRPMM